MTKKQKQIPEREFYEDIARYLVEEKNCVRGAWHVKFKHFNGHSHTQGPEIDVVGINQLLGKNPAEYKKFPEIYCVEVKRGGFSTIGQLEHYYSLLENIIEKGKVFLYCGIITRSDKFYNQTFLEAVKDRMDYGVLMIPEDDNPIEELIETKARKLSKSKSGNTNLHLSKKLRSEKPTIDRFRRGAKWENVYP